MLRAQNIAKIGQRLAPRQLAGWGLVLIILLLAMPRYAHAQNSSTAPYIDSWHLYRVGMENITNTITWQLMEGDSLTPGTTYLLDETTYAWVDTFNVDDVQDYANIEIKFIDGIFDPGETWYLVYREWDEANPGLCVSKRSLKINIVDNTFYLALNDDESNCNSLAGEVLDWEDIDWAGLGHVGDTWPVPSYLDFTIHMHKSANHTLNTWTFDGSVTMIDGNFTCDSIRSVDSTYTGLTSAGMSFTLTNPTANTVSLIADGPALPTAAPTILSDTVVVRVFISGLVYEWEHIQFEVSNGIGTSGTLYSVETDDNTALGGDRQQVHEILPLPPTPNIVLND